MHNKFLNWQLSLKQEEETTTGASGEEIKRHNNCISEGKASIKRKIATFGLVQKQQ